MSHRTITIKTVSTPRYDTAGDWVIDDAGNLTILVTEESVLNREGFLIALHEMVEAFLCMERGISQESVDKFDMAFDGHGEPGDDPDAPYRKEHRFAMLIEHLMAHELGMKGYGLVQ